MKNREAIVKILDRSFKGNMGHILFLEQFDKGCGADGLKFLPQNAINEVEAVNEIEFLISNPILPDVTYEADVADETIEDETIEQEEIVIEEQTIEQEEIVIEDQTIEDQTIEETTTATPIPTKPKKRRTKKTVVEPTPEPEPIVEDQPIVEDVNLKQADEDADILDANTDDI